MATMPTKEDKAVVAVVATPQAATPPPSPDGFSGVCKAGSKGASPALKGPVPSAPSARFGGVFKSGGGDTALYLCGTEALGTWHGVIIVSALAAGSRHFWMGRCWCSQVTRRDFGGGQKLLKIPCPGISIHGACIWHSGLGVEVDLGLRFTKPGLVQARLDPSSSEAFEFRQDEQKALPSPAGAEMEDRRYVQSLQKKLEPIFACQAVPQKPDEYEEPATETCVPSEERASEGESSEMSTEDKDFNFCFLQRSNRSAASDKDHRQVIKEVSQRELGFLLRRLQSRVVENCFELEAQDVLQLFEAQLKQLRATPRKVPKTNVMNFEMALTRMTFVSLGIIGTCYEPELLLASCIPSWPGRLWKSRRSCSKASESLFL
ncbi:unnamed protein product [Symbiodinium sp. CCMP2592]|nr:unnamed protein product [Symbiodinium sp. CCMP2592]